MFQEKSGHEHVKLSNNGHSTIDVVLVPINFLDFGVLFDGQP
jgi:hypothetical protein